MAAPVATTTSAEPGNSRCVPVAPPGRSTVAGPGSTALPFLARWRCLVRHQIHVGAQAGGRILNIFPIQRMRLLSANCRTNSAMNCSSYVSGRNRPSVGSVQVQLAFIIVCVPFAYRWSCKATYTHPKTCTVHLKSVRPTIPCLVGRRRANEDTTL